MLNDKQIKHIKKSADMVETITIDNKTITTYYQKVSKKSYVKLLEEIIIINRD